MVYIISLSDWRRLQNPLSFFFELDPKKPLSILPACPVQSKERSEKILKKRYPDVIGLGIAKCGTGKVKILLKVLQKRDV